MSNTDNTTARQRKEAIGRAREWLGIAREQRLIGQHDAAEKSRRFAAGYRRSAFVVIARGAQ
jgi:hypothetical protein